jgi:hypothetical protein
MMGPKKRSIVKMRFAPTSIKVIDKVLELELREDWVARKNGRGRSILAVWRIFPTVRNCRQ